MGLLVVFLCALLSLNLSAQTINVDLSEEHQTMDGIGGNAYGWITDTNKWCPTVLDKIINELNVTHIRFRSSIKLIEVNNDNSDPWTINWSGIKEKGLSIYDFKMLKKLSDAGIECILGIWEVPDWMTTNPNASTYRIIPPSMYDEYAELICAFLLHAKNNYDVDINYIGIHNEPNIGIFDYFSPQGLVDVTKVIVQHLDHHGLGHVKLMVSDVNQPNDCVSYAMPSLKCKDFNDRIAAFSFHTWHNMNPTHLIPIMECSVDTGYPNWATEVGASNLNSTTFDWALGSLKRHHQSIKFADSSMTFQWTLGGAESSIAKDGTPYPVFYAMKHYNLHIHPGSVRVDSGDDINYLYTTAFKDKKTKELSIVCINTDTYGKNVDFNLGKGRMGFSKPEVIKTTSSMNYSNLGKVNFNCPWNFDYYIEGESFHTFKCKYNHVPTTSIQMATNKMNPNLKDYVITLYDNDGIDNEVTIAGMAIYVGGKEAMVAIHGKSNNPSCFYSYPDPSGKAVVMMLVGIPKHLNMTLVGGGADKEGCVSFVTCDL